MDYFLAARGIVIILSIGALASLLVFLDRILRFRRAMVDPSSFLQGVLNLMDKGSLEEAISICEEAPGPLAAVAREALARRDDSPMVLHDALAVVGQEEIERLNRRISVLLLIARISPLLGLVGTIFGIRSGLYSIASNAPVMTPSVFANVLGGAIGAAAAGLIVATLCYVLHHILSEQLARLAQDLTAGTATLFRYFAGSKEEGHETL